MESTEYRGAMMEGPRPARRDELPAVIALSNDVFQGMDMGTAFPTLFTEDNAHNLFVFVDEGRPVALAGMTIQDLAIGEAVVHTACIGSVCTLASHRGRGLAAHLVDSCLAAAAASGVSLVLVSGGRGLYRRIGFIDAGLFRVISADGQGAYPEVSCRIREVHEWNDSDLAELHALHEREPVRFVRSPGVMATLLRSGALHARPARTWAVRAGEGSDERSTAYLCISDSKVREFAGGRPSILAALPLILAETGEESLEMEVRASDVEMVRCAAACRLRGRGTGMDGTLKITNPRAFFRSVSPLLPRGLSVEFAESLHARTDADLAALVFGSVEHAAPDHGAGRLGSLLENAFPLPLPGYGLNYI
jgi:predicted N-acetyltransferase YhbS